MQYSETIDVRPPTMRWSAVIAGWLVATGIASLLYVGGLAVGFTAFDPYNAEMAAKGIGIGSAIWIVLTWMGSLFLGGMFASWFDGRSDQTVGTLHGITVWGLSVAATGLLVVLGLTQVVQGGAAIVGGGIATAPAGFGTAGPQVTRGPASEPAVDAMIGLQAQLSRSVAQNSAGVRASEPLDRRNMAAVASALIKGQDQNARALLLANTSMSESEIDQTLQSLSAEVEKYKSDIKAAADAAARYTAMAMWIIFFSTLISLVAAGIGGWMGAGHIHRVHVLPSQTNTPP